jgi:hypothetical protein
MIDAKKAPQGDPQPIKSPEQAEKSDGAPAPKDEAKPAQKNLVPDPQEKTQGGKGTDEKSEVRSSSVEKEDFGDDDIRAGSLAVDRETALQLFGWKAGFTKSRMSGQTAVGDNNTIVNVVDGHDPQPYVGALTHIAEQRRTYAPNLSDDELSELLSARHVVCLSGKPGTGRFTAACMALAEQHGVDGIHEIVLPGNTQLESLWRNGEVPLKGKGHVLRLAAQHDCTRLRPLEDVFRRRGARLVAITSASSGPDGLRVSHEPADPSEILRAHLRAALTPEGTEPDAYLEMTSVRVAVAAAYRPREIVDIAGRIAKQRPLDEEQMERLLAESTPRQRERGERALLLKRDHQSFPGTQRDQYLRAFRMTYALFHGRPLHYVFDAVDLLLEVANVAAGWPKTLRTSLEHPVSDLLGEDLAQDWEDARKQFSATATGTSRTARLRDPGLRGILLDLAWHEFDGTHHTLVKWLQALVDRGDDVMRRTAADAAALLMSHDFDLAQRLLIDGWAKNPRSAVRQVAAWSVATAYIGGGVEQQVRDQVRKWVGETARYRDTAARVYASGLRQPHLQWTMGDLLQIAMDRGQRRNAVIGEALSELYDRAYAGPFVAGLRLWLGDDAPREVHAHVVRAASKLLQREHTNYPGCAELLVLVADKTVAVDDLETLWRHVLFEPDTATRPWSELAGWLGSADENTDLRPGFTEILQRLADDSVIERRLRYYLPRSGGNRPLPEWVLQAMER